MSLWIKRPSLDLPFDNDTLRLRSRRPIPTRYISFSRLRPPVRHSCASPVGTDCHPSQESVEIRFTPTVRLTSTRMKRSATSSLNICVLFLIPHSTVKLRGWLKTFRKLEDAGSKILIGWQWQNMHRISRIRLALPLIDCGNVRKHAGQAIVTNSAPVGS